MSDIRTERCPSCGASSGRHYRNCPTRGFGLATSRCPSCGGTGYQHYRNCRLFPH